MLIEKLKRYEVAKAQGPVAKPDDLNGEERFYLKKVSQKKSNYVPIGRRGVFGGVILNMQLHWKKHETVKVICKPCKPGQIQEFASEIARLSGGVPINTVGSDTIVFYRGKDYVQPDVMSPIDTLSKKKVGRLSCWFILFPLIGSSRCLLLVVSREWKLQEIFPFITLLVVCFSPWMAMICL